jgi:hypothetical protein
MICSRNAANKIISKILITILVAIKCAATLNGLEDSHKISVRLIPRCTRRKRIRKIPARATSSFLPMLELKILLIFGWFTDVVRNGLLRIFTPAKIKVRLR